MIDFDFILHYASYSVPLFWCSTVLYIYIKSTRLLQRSTIFYFVLIILYGSSQLLVWAWAELNLSTSGMGLDRAQPVSLFVREWATLFVGLSHILISPSPIAPQIFTLWWRERFDRNNGEIRITIQCFERNAVGSSMVSHSIRKYCSVHYYRLWMGTSRSVLWVKNSVINSKKFELEHCGNKINPFSLT